MAPLNSNLPNVQAGGSGSMISLDLNCAACGAKIGHLDDHRHCSYCKRMICSKCLEEQEEREDDNLSMFCCIEIEGE